MKISCVDKNVGQFLKESFYRIPRFQRPYSWDRTNVEEFWTDTVVESQSQYFIGNFVVYDDKTALGVVDGQQRLTTITLLLCALRDVFEREGFSSLATGIHGLIERNDISDEKFYVLQTETSYPYLQLGIQMFRDVKEALPAPGPEEQFLIQAFEYFHENLNGAVQGIKDDKSLSVTRKKQGIKAKLTEIRDKILGLNLICTALENDEDAYVIFETLNTRGKDLTLSDLVKSHLSRLLKPKNRGVDLAKDKWSKLNETFEASQIELSVSTFIHHHWLSKYEYITEKKLFKALRKRIKKADAAAFLDDLLKESNIYRYIHEPSSKKWSKEEIEVRNALEGMSLFRIKQQLPLVMSVLRHYEDKTLKTKQVKRILHAIENFHFVFTAITSQRSSGGISLMYASAARELYKSTDAAARTKTLQDFETIKLADRLPQYDEFEPKFVDLKYSKQMSKQKKLVQYVLTRIYQKNSIGLAIDPEQVTIEHIAPENPAKGTGVSKNHVASIGNLILIDQKLNGLLANKSFTDKIKVLKNAHVWIDPIILNATSWGATEIEARARFLANDAYKNVWNL